MLTNAGNRVFSSRVEGGTAFFGGNFYMVCSTDTAAAAASDTSIPGEQSGNGLGRAVVSAAHTSGSNVWTFANTFTYTGTTLVNINKIALFDAATGGNLIAEYNLSTPTPFQNSGDNATWSIVLSV